MNPTEKEERGKGLEKKALESFSSDIQPLLFVAQPRQSPSFPPQLVRPRHATR